MTEKIKALLSRKQTRRDLLKNSALLGGSALVASQAPWVLPFSRRTEAGEAALTEQLYELSKSENQLRTVCLQCNTGCGIKVKLLNGTAVKIDGNPYSPWTMTPHLPYATPLEETATIDGALCPKGQAGIQTAYDPYRIIKVLKRAGPRGSNRWQSIPFEQAVREIVDGGKLFAHLGENRVVEGLKDIYALRDPKVAKEMAADVDKIRKKQMTVAEFKEKHKANLHLLIDPDHPDLGPKNNQFVFLWGRLKGGREHLIRRFTGDALGSVNAHGHTTVCQGSLYFTCKAMSEQYEFDEKEGHMKWRGGKKFYWQADTANCQFIIFVGASPFEGNYGPPQRAGKITDGLVEGRLKFAVVDPRLSKTASKAWKWIPAKPGTEGALALGMIRWILDNQRYDAQYLTNANKAAATADKESTWTNATWLVKIEKDGTPGAFLRAHEIGMPKETRTATVKDKTVSYEFEPLVVWKDGTPVAFDPYDEKKPVEGELFVDREINGIQVKSGLQLLRESAFAHSIEEWAEICGIAPEDIIDLAREFTGYGKRAAADIHRGVSQHTNGFYNVLAWMSLNLLIGNYDWAGGMIKATTFDPVGEKENKPFDLRAVYPAKSVPFGLSIIRHDAKYEESTLFAGYPAKRPWYPLSSDIYQEVIPSAGDAYPYPIKALFLYMGTPVYSLPAGHALIDILTDTRKIPLFVASDIIIGETSMYADYIFPDLSFLERWEFHGSHPNVAPKVQPIRQPVIAPIPETVKVFGEEMPISLEALLLAIAERMQLAGFGPNGLGEGRDFKRPEDYYLRMVANVAAGDKAGEEVPDASDSELKLFMASRRHLPKRVFDAARWEKIVGPTWWRKVVYVLNRGGRFQDYEKAYEGDKVKNRYGTLINLYSEKAAKAKSAMTGKRFSGIAIYEPAPADCLGRPIDDEMQGFTLNLITYREIFHTKSRTIADYWLLKLLPENFVLMNSADAKRLGFGDGDLVRVVSAVNPEGAWDLKNGRKKPMVGKLKVIEGIRPGTVAFSLGHGHWAYGSSVMTIDGNRLPADERRGKGIHANAAMRIDPYLKNTGLSDPVGASVSFYDSQVKVVKAE